MVERGYTVQNVFIEATPGAISPPSAGMPGQGGRAPGEFGQAEQGGGQGGATGGEAGGAHGQHLRGPVFEPRIISGEPGVIVARASVIGGGDQQ